MHSRDSHEATQALVEAWGRITLSNLSDKIDDLKILQGTILAKLNQNTGSSRLSDYEFKVFSQFGEDGIIQFLTQSIAIPHKTFIEFGVGDFMESNCRFLLMKDNWKGFVLDSSAENINSLIRNNIYWKYHLGSRIAHVTRDNINELLDLSGFDRDLGILSVDIDGVDYYVVEAVSSYKPRILILEYNAVFGGSRKISVPYSPDFNRTEAHHSNLYAGASLSAMNFLAEKLGYALVGSNLIGNNAFFVREDLLNERVRKRTVSDVFASSNLRESRNELGQLTFLDGDRRIEAIQGMPIFNVETGEIEVL